jgi:hypothetical protein
MSYYFDHFERRWDCELMGDGDEVDEAAFESKFGTREKVAVVMVVKAMRDEWCKLTGTVSGQVIFSKSKIVERNDEFI